MCVCVKGGSVTLFFFSLSFFFLNSSLVNEDESSAFIKRQERLLHLSLKKKKEGRKIKENGSLSSCTRAAARVNGVDGD